MSTIDDVINDILVRSEQVISDLQDYANTVNNIPVPDANTRPGAFATLLVGSDNDNNIGPDSDATLKVITDQTTPYVDNPTFVNFSGTNSDGGVISVRKARGSQANVVALEDGDIVGGMYAAGHDGTDFQPTAALRFKVDGVVNAAAALETPMKVVIETKDETGATAERLVVKPDGVVGIGTTDPTAPLSILASDGSTTIGGSTSVIKVRNPSGVLGATSGLEFFHGNVETDVQRLCGIYGRYDQFNAAGFGGELVFGTSASGNTDMTEAMRIDPNGNVGIGTTAPESLLQVGFNNSGNNYITIGRSGLSESGVQWSRSGNIDSRVFVDSSENLILSCDDTNLGASNIVFRNGNSTERMRIDSNGNVNIGGTTSSSSKLKLIGDGSTYTNYNMLLEGGVADNATHGISLMATGDALGGILGSNFELNNVTASQSNSLRSSGYIQFGNSTIAGVTSTITFGGMVKGSSTMTPRMTIDSNGDLFSYFGSSISDYYTAKNLGYFAMGAGGVDDEYLILTQYHTTGTVTPTGIHGTIYFSRGNTGSGNVLNECSLMVQDAWTGSIVFNFQQKGTDRWNSIDIIDVAGNQYLALRADFIGGDSVNGLVFQGRVINQPDDSLILTRVRESDANVTVITSNYAQPTGVSGGSSENNSSLIFKTALTERMRIDSSGDVGIGETDPATKLEVRGNTASGPDAEIVRVTASDSVSRILMANSVGQGGIDTSGDNIRFVNTASNTERMRIDTSGNVGIGTDTPLTNLEIYKDNPTATNIGYDGAELFLSGKGWDTNLGGYVHGWKFSTPTAGYSAGTGHSNSYLVFNQMVADGISGTSNPSFVERMRIDDNGNVGIGTDTPTAILHTNGGESANGAVVQSLDLQHKGSGDTGYECEIRMGRPTTANRRVGIRAIGKGLNFTAPELAFDTNEVERIRIDSIGNVGIGTGAGATINYKLEVNGSFAATSKSFDIEHPTKENMRLRYGSLEGPENGVYVRGKIKDEKEIVIPDYWTGLVHEDSITVNLTAIGGPHQVWVDRIENNIVYVDSTSATFEYFFIIFAERKDIDKMTVEYEAE